MSRSRFAAEIAVDNGILFFGSRNRRRKISGHNMVLGLLSSGEINEFTRSLAQDIARRYPPVIANDPEQTVSEKRGAEILGIALSSVERFKRERRLGFFRRLMLGSAFKQALKEKGYDEAFIEFAAAELAIHLHNGLK